MKKQLLLSLILTMALSSLGQSGSSNPDSITFYNQKAKRLNTTGVILEIAGGIGLTVAAISEVNQLDGLMSADAPGDEWHSYAGLYAISGALIVAGVVFFIEGGKAKKKAKAMSTTFHFKLDQTEILQRGMVANKLVPAVSLTLPLR